jgi:site-specific DNA-methyltransferase (adenine-specific)
MIEIINGDCVAEMEKLGKQSVNCIVTSPPYNFDINYNEYDDGMPRDKYLDWLVDVAHSMHKVLTKDGSIFLNVGFKPTDPWLPYDVLNVFRRTFYAQNQFIWAKSAYVPQAKKTYGHFRPLNSPRFVNRCWEFVFHLTRTSDVVLDRLALGVPYEDKSNKRRWSNPDDLRCRGDVWFIPYETKQKKGKHPATFPPKLAMYAYALHGLDRIELAMDPFVGEGNSAVAAKKLDLNFVGIDIDSLYCEIARKAVKG